MIVKDEPTSSLTELMGMFWITLGPALFAVGEWRDSWAALKPAPSLNPSSPPSLTLSEKRETSYEMFTKKRMLALAGVTFPPPCLGVLCDRDL